MHDHLSIGESSPDEPITHSSGFRPGSASRRIGKNFKLSLCNSCDLAPRSNFSSLPVLMSHAFKKERNMQRFVRTALLPIVLGATLLAGGCATKESAMMAQAAADAARMQADLARDTAERALSQAQSATQRADQANSTAQQAQQTASDARNSAQTAEATALQAKNDALAAEERAQAERAAFEQERAAPPRRTTRLARGERG